MNLGFTTSTIRRAQHGHPCAPRYITSGSSSLTDAQLRPSKPIPPAPRHMEFHAPPQVLHPLLVAVLLSCSSRTRSQIEMGVVPAVGTRLLRQCHQNVCRNRNWRRSRWISPNSPTAYFRKNSNWSFEIDFPFCRTLEYGTYEHPYQYKLIICFFQFLFIIIERV